MRFAEFQGVPGHLVSDPETAHVSRRYVGMRLDGAKADATEHADRFTPFRQIRVVSHDLKAAVAHGELTMTSPVVDAASHDEAERKINALSHNKTAAKKGDS